MCLLDNDDNGRLRLTDGQTDGQTDLDLVDIDDGMVKLDWLSVAAAGLSRVRQRRDGADAATLTVTRRTNVVRCH